MEPEFNLRPRVGTFFLLVGFGLLLIFLGSEFSREPDFNFFFMGLGALFLGLLFRRRPGGPPQTSRFQTLRRIHGLTRKPRQDPRRKPDPKKK